MLGSKSTRGDYLLEHGGCSDRDFGHSKDRALNGALINFSNWASTPYFPDWELQDWRMVVDLNKAVGTQLGFGLWFTNHE